MGGAVNARGGNSTPIPITPQLGGSKYHAMQAAMLEAELAERENLRVINLRRELARSLFLAHTPE